MRAHADVKQTFVLHPNTKEMPMPIQNTPAPDWLHIAYEELPWWKANAARWDNRIQKYRNETRLGGGDWCPVFAHWVMQQLGIPGAGIVRAEARRRQSVGSAGDRRNLIRPAAGPLPSCRTEKWTFRAGKMFRGIM